MSFDHTIKKGQPSKIVEVMLRDSSTGDGKTGVAHGSVTASYVREGGARTAITLASGTAGDIYSSGKWAEVDATNCKGLYQLHIPDAALATGADAVTIQLQASGVLDKPIRISLLDVDLRDAVDAGLTNLDATISSRSSHAAPSVPTAAQIRAEIDSNSTQLAAILADTNELQTDNIPGLIAALNNISAADILTTALTESYAAAGAAPTLTQLLMLVHQVLVGKREQSGTTFTTKRLDGTTNAAVQTVDDATTPTSIERAS